MVESNQGESKAAESAFFSPLAMRLADKALKGDHKSIEAILKYGVEASSEVKLPPMDTDPARESGILDAYLRRLDEGDVGHGYACRHSVRAQHRMPD